MCSVVLLRIVFSHCRQIDGTAQHLGCLFVTHPVTAVAAYEASIVYNDWSWRHAECIQTRRRQQTSQNSSVEVVSTIMSTFIRIKCTIGVRFLNSNVDP